MGLTPVILPTGRKPQKGLVHAHEVGALHPRIENFFSGVRMPMYKANDSDDLHLMELISPSQELHRKLIEGRSRPMTRQHTPVYLQSPNKSLDTTPRTKYKQTALKTLQSFPLSTKLNARLFGTDHVRPKSANVGGKQRKPLKKQSTMAEERHQNTLEFEDIRIYKSELSTHRKPDSETSSGFSSEKRAEMKLSLEDQKAYELRLISKLWHQDCKSSIPIQQKLAYLLNSKYKEVFEDGRMFTYEKCKHNDFKAEVAQILKNLERAGAPQMATLNLKYALAVACVDEVLGKGMGEEYMKLEGYYLQQSCGVRVTSWDAALVKEIAGRVQREYVDVQHVTGFMLDQLSSLSDPLLLT